MFGQRRVLQRGPAASEEVVGAAGVVEGVGGVGLRAVDHAVARRRSGRGRARPHGRGGGGRRSSSGRGRGRLVAVGVQRVDIQVRIFVIGRVVGEVRLRVEGVGGTRGEGVGGVHGSEVDGAAPRRSSSVLRLERPELYVVRGLGHGRRHQAFRIYELLVVLQPHHRQQGCLPWPHREKHEAGGGKGKAGRQEEASTGGTGKNSSGKGGGDGRGSKIRVYRSISTIQKYF